MPITESDIEKIALLAHLEITDDEMAVFGPQIAEIVVFFDQLVEVDTRGVQEDVVYDHAGIVESGLRSDVVTESLGRGSAGASAPDFAHGYFRVPKIL